MRTALLLFLSILFSPTVFVSAEESNAGIVRGIWYGSEQVFAGEATRMYVAIRNNTGSDLSGTIEFFDGSTKLERKQIQALDGRIIESWTDWKPEYGTHTVTANLSRTQLYTIGSSTQEVDVISVSTKDVLFVDYDTDKDNIGNQTDTDDDDDGISDATEKTNGTNPLRKEVSTSHASTDDSSKINDVSNQQEKIKTQTQDEGSNNTQQGLERYLAPSKTQSTLSTVTHLITKTKQSLDAYRDTRAQELQNKEARDAEQTVNKDGFGEITRTSEADKNKISLPHVTGKGFFEKLFALMGNAITVLYTFILATLSFVLSHPIFMQLGILLFLLFGLIKLASKFGRRPSLKKR